ncbi:MAG: DUF2080 family transposase-associated protein [Candidatus Nanoarchaeia archaeon]
MKTSKDKKPKKKTDKRIEINSKEIKVDLEKLQKDVMKAYESMKKIIPESITEREIKPFGNASHIILPKEYAYKKAKVIIKK